MRWCEAGGLVIMMQQKLEPEEPGCGSEWSGVRGGCGRLDVGSVQWAMFMLVDGLVWISGQFGRCVELMLGGAVIGLVIGGV